MKISIVRTGTKSHPKTIEGAWEAVEFVERTMQMPFPVDHVLIVLNKEAVSDHAAGNQGRFHISYIPLDEHANITRKMLLRGLAHETAHYYWGAREGGQTAWVNEGMADTLSHIYEVEVGIRNEISPIPPKGRGNCEAYDLETFEKGEYERPIGMLDNCPYYLGSALFLELREKLGTEEFNRRIQELHRVYEAARKAGPYLESESYKYTDIYGLRQVFHDQLEVVEKHWSGRMNAPENRS